VPFVDFPPTPPTAAAAVSEGLAAAANGDMADGLLARFGCDKKFTPDAPPGGAVV
jgi:hypothetical protein